VTVSPSAAETRAIAFVGFLIVAVLTARWLDRPRTLFDGDDSVDLAALEEATRGALSAAARCRAGMAEGERIDPNSATAAELTRLPRVGPALAERILAARQDRPFESAADLARVPGIGPAMIDALADHIALPRGAAAAVAPLATPAPGGTPRGRDAGGSVGYDEPVDINRASAVELVQLPGIGPAIAQRIIVHRDSAGPFRTLDDLLAVRGIGPAILERLRPFVHHEP
jgi:competence ComEA-like helix-hairpin-helix protein